MTQLYRSLVPTVSYAAKQLEPRETGYKARANSISVFL